MHLSASASSIREVRAVVLRSGKPRVFCAGANIRMLAGASHAHKVNFCKFTNETRNAIEDEAPVPALRTICVINGTAAGGGYELALAADHIMLVDDGSAAVSLPEVPLLAVLPGTGGLTRSSTSARCAGTAPICSARPKKALRAAAPPNGGLWTKSSPRRDLEPRWRRAPGICGCRHRAGPQRQIAGVPEGHRAHPAAMRCHRIGAITDMLRVASTGRRGSPTITLRGPDRPPGIG